MVDLIYVQFSGFAYSSEKTRADPIFRGYSGAGAHKNVPESQCKTDLGPIPIGRYKMSLLVEHLGMKNVVRLMPDKDNDMCGRSGFLIHGDSVSDPGTASSGCIICNGEDLRKRLVDDFKSLVVVSRDLPLMSPEVLEDEDIFKAEEGSPIGLFHGLTREDAPKLLIPDLLGRGYRTFGEKAGSRIIDHNALVSPVRMGSSVESKLGLLLTREELETALRVDVSVEGSYGFGSAKASASLRKDFSSSQTSVYLAFTKRVLTGVYSLAQYPVLETALEDARNPSQFTLDYGNALIDTVGLGGSICYIFKFDFDSERQATHFKGSIGGSYGSFSGSISTELKEVISKAKASINLFGYTSGSLSTPDLFKNLELTEEGDLFSGDIGVNSLANLLAFFDDFNKHFQDRHEVEGLSQCYIEVEDINTVPLRLENRREISDLGNSAVGVAGELKSALRVCDSTLAQLNYVPRVEHFSTQEIRDEASKLAARVKMVREKITDRYDQLLRTLDTRADYHFKSQIPEIPSHFSTADPLFEETTISLPRNQTTYADFPSSHATGDVTCVVQVEGNVSTVGHRPNGCVMVAKILQLNGSFREKHDEKDLATGVELGQDTQIISRGKSASAIPILAIFRPNNEEIYYAASVSAHGDYRSTATMTLRTWTSQQTTPDTI
jgi:Protein of unknown function (DUF2778)